MDVRDAGAHRAAARAAAERGRLDVWVNNAGVMRTVKAWEHPDDDVRLMVDVNLLGVIWGSRAAVDAMRGAPGGRKHLINMGSLSALAPVPGLAVYGATKHARARLQRGAPGRPDGGEAPDHGALRLSGRRRHRAAARPGAKKDSAIIWSAPRMLSPEEVADRTVALLDSRAAARGDAALPRAGSSGCWRCSRGSVSRTATVLQPRGRATAGDARAGHDKLEARRRGDGRDDRHERSRTRHGRRAPRDWIEVENPATGGVAGDGAPDDARDVAGAGRARPGRPARLGGDGLRGPRRGAAPRPEVDARQLRAA